MFASQKKYLFQTPSNIVFDRKLDTALRASTVSNFYRRVRTRTLTSDDRLITESQQAQTGLPDDVSTLGYTDILAKILNDSWSGVNYMSAAEGRKSMIRQTACTTAVDLQLDLLLEKYELPDKTGLKESIHRFLGKTKDSLLLSNILAVLGDLTRTVERSHEINNKKFKFLPEDERLPLQLRENYYHDPRELFSCTWSRNLLLVTTTERTYVYPRQYLLLIHNKLADLASVLMLAQYHAGSSLPANTINQLMDFIQTLMELHYEFDTKFYTIAKSLEALCVAETLIEVDDWVNDEFLLALSRDLRKDPEFNYRGSKLRRLIVKAGPVLRHELCCLSKLLGHPLVLMLEGSISLHKTVNESYTINPLRIVECTNHVKENYIRNYILKYGVWPPAHITNINCSEGLKEAWSLGIDPNSRLIKSKFGKIPISEYVHVEILPNMKFDYLHNALEHIKDKTITLLRSEIIARYINGDYQGRSPEWAETRLLLFYMLHDKMTSDHVAFIKQFEGTPDLASLVDYLVIRIVPKEKELKECFRGFGCQTYFGRSRCLAQEKNAMHYLDLYCDEQAMTLNELELVKKLYALRTIKKAYPGHIPIYISIDASKWNNHFRAETVDVVMKETLDKVFGTKIFGKTHEAYKNTLFYVPDEEETYWWEGQAGGIEGLNQDTWVVTYLAQIKVAMKSFDFKYQAFCKGDDFRLVVMVPPNIVDQIPISELKTNIVEEVSRIASEFGHKIKVLESYGSCTYFSFSKAASYDVVEFPQGFRKIQKSYGVSNSLVPTLDEYIAAAFSNGHSSCATEPHVLGCYMVAVKWAVWYIHMDNHYADLGESQLTALLLVPSLIGGFPIIYLHNMFVRAESDLLPPFIALLQSTARSKPSVYKYMANFMRLPVRPPKSIVGLCKDPYALPGDRPDLPSTLLRKMLVESLRSMVKHEDLIALFRAYDSGYTGKVLACLQSANVYNPKVFSLIYSSTPTGQVEELTRKFESSRSVHEVLILRRGSRVADNLLRRVIRAEFKLQAWRRGRLDGVRTRGTTSILRYIVACPTESAQVLRDVFWNKPVEGITTPPLAHLIKLTTPYTSSDPPWDSQNAFLLCYYKPVLYIPRHEGEDSWASSNKEPFMGHTTSSGSLLPTARLVEKDPIVSKIKTNLELISWTDRKGMDRHGNLVTSNCPQLLDHLVRSYTSMSTKDLLHFGATHTYGTIDHHLASRKFKATIARNTLVNIYTQFDGDSTYNRRIGRDPGHYYINYLSIFCHGVCMASLGLCFHHTHNPPQQMWLVTDKCSYCCRPIVETPIVMDLSPIEGLKAPKILSTAVGKRALKLLHEAVEEFNSREFRDMPSDHELTLEDATLGVIQEMVDSTVHDKRRLEERYTDHNLTEAGQKTLSALQPRALSAGFSHHEFNTLQPSMMVGPICSIIYDYCNQMFIGVASDRIAEYASQLPLEQLPWYSIVAKLYAMNLLKPFLRIIEKKRGVRASVGHVNILHATLYLAEACLYLVEKWDIPPSCVYLTHYPVSKFRHHFVRTLRFAHRTWANTRFTSILRDADHAMHPDAAGGNRISTMVRAHCLMVTLIYTFPLFDEDHITDLLQDLGEHSMITESLINTADMDYDTFIEGEEFRTANGLPSLVALYPSLPWADVLEATEDEYNQVLYDARELAITFRMKIVCTTASDCVNTLRAAPEDPVDEDHANEDLFHHLMDHCLLPTPRLDAKVGYIMEFPKTDFVGSLVRPLAASLSFSDSKIILDRSYLYRPFGDATLSMSKMSEIWGRMGMPERTEKPLSVIVFGDGLGGTSTFVAATAPGSYIQLLTLPDKPGDDGIPSLTRTYAELNDCYIDGSAISSGVSDASKIETFELLEKNPRTYDIVISDIEYKWVETPESYNITRNISLFYLKNRSLDGILIMQVKLTEPNVIYNIARYLVPHCIEVRLAKIRSSTRHEQAYIVAWGCKQTCVVGYNSYHRGESSRVYDAIGKFISQVHTRYLSDCDHTNVSLKIHELTWPYHKRWLGVLPFRLEIVMYKELSIRMDVCKFITDIKAMPRLAECLALVFPIGIDRQIGELAEYFERSRHPHIRKINVDLNTRKHAQKTYEKLLLLEGFKACVMKYIAHPYSSVTDIEIRQAYRLIISQAPHRLKIPALSGQHFKYKMVVDGMKISPYPHYFSGWSLGVEYCALVAMLIKYKDRL